MKHHHGLFVNHETTGSGMGRIADQRIDIDDTVARQGQTIPRAPRALPFLGHAWQLRRHPLRFLESLPAHGDVVRIRVGGDDAVVVCDPDLVGQLLRNDRVFDKQRAFIEAQREVGGVNLLTCSHGEHRQLRRLFQPAFHPSRMPGYAALMRNQIDRVVGSWRDGQVLDITPDMHRISIGVILATMVDHSVDHKAVDEVIEALKSKNAGQSARIFLPPFLRKLLARTNRSYDQSLSRMSQLINDFLATYRPDVHPNTLASMIIAASDGSDTPAGSGRRLSEVEVSDNLFAFVFAGSDTTANAVGWALHLLSEHPEIQERLHAELDATLAGATATIADLPRLTFTGDVLTEALRLYPPGWMSNRATTADVSIRGFHIPAGTVVFWSAYLIHRCADLYPHPERFDPDRWARRPQVGPAANDFIPFSTGARRCIGDAFARVEATLMLAAIFSRWRLDAVPGRPVRPCAGGSILVPSHVTVRLTARN